MLKMKAKQFDVNDERKAVGLVNGGHTILKCSNCGKGLIDIFHTQPDAIDPRTNKPFEWKAQAICCYCGDHSYVTDIKGKFYLGGYCEKPDDENGNSLTQPDGFDEKTIDGETVMIIKTVRAK